MRATPLPLIGGFYADETRPWSQQDICNYLPVGSESEGTRTPTMAKTPPGLSPFARISGEPSRGVYSAEDRLFTVMGNTLYQVTPTGSTVRGSISGVGRVRFAHNQITNGNQVLIVNGSAGWVWNTVTSALTLITDTGYPGAINARFIDGYLIQIEPARRFAFHSDLADALSYNTLDRFTSEVSPDLLVSMAVSNNELLLFSERTTEFFENTGATQQPFRSKRISFNKGCAGRYTVAEMDNTVFWLGDDGSFYRLEGYSPIRISTRPIEQAIRGLNWEDAFSFVWEDSGHAVCYWTFPGGLTFGYDASQQKWHRRASYGFDLWRVQDMAYWQRRWIAGDFQKGRLYELDWAYPWEFDQEFVSEITSPVIHDNQSRVLMPRLEIIMDTGQDAVPVRGWEIDAAPLSITGDVPNGIITDLVTGQYTVTGGVIPYGPISVLTGTFPPGLTLAANGSYSGRFSAAGNYSWTVGGVDADGTPFSVADSSTVTAIEWLAVSVATDAKLSLDGTDWVNGPSYPSAVISGGSLYFGGGEILCTNIAGPYASRSTNGGQTWTNLNAPSTQASGGDACRAGGYWHYSTGASGTPYFVSRWSQAGGWETVATAPSADVIKAGPNQLVAVNVFGPHLYTSPLDGSVWTYKGQISGGTVNSGTASLFVGSTGEAGYFGVEPGNFGGTATTDYRAKLFRSIDEGNTFTLIANPIPDLIDPAGADKTLIHRNSILGLWVIVANRRIAYGPALNNLSLSATVLSGSPTQMGSDGTRFTIAGQFGLITSVDGNVWTPLTTNISGTVEGIVSLH